MKKIVAVLLTAAMVLSLAGCTKEETTKKKKTKKTTEDTEDTDDPTDDPSDDPTDDPTDTTDTTPVVTTDDPTSDEPTDTSAAPSGNPVFALHSQRSCETIGYAHTIDDGGYSTLDGVDMLFEYSNFTVTGFDELEDAVYSCYYELEDAMYQGYRERVQAYANGELDRSEYGVAYTEIYRDDSYIFSFITKVSTCWNGRWDGLNASHSFFSETGEEILLSDIITDMDGFLAAVDEWGKIANVNDADLTDPEFLSSIKDGTCQFTLTYDGIVLYYQDWIDFKIPVFAISDCINFRYFGSAPDTYGLELNADGSIEWDFDGDGIPDRLVVKDPNGELLDEVVFEYNGEEYTLKGDAIWGELHLEERRNYIMKASDGYYLYLLVGVDEGIEYSVFTFQNGAWTPVGRFPNEEYIRSYPFDPSNVEMSVPIGILGTNYMYSDYSLDGTGGMPVANYDMFYKDSFYLETKVDLTGFAVADDYSIGDETTIPAKSVVQVIEYDPVYEEFLFEVCFPDDEENYYVAIAVGGTDPDYTIGGYPVDEALDGIFYGN